MLLRLTFLILAVFIGCSLWLAYVWSDGIRTADWVEVPASVEHQILKDPNAPPEKREWTTSVAFNVDGADHTALLDGYSTGDGDFRLFVNPDDLTQVATESGPDYEKMFQPLIGTCASGLVGLLLLLITFFGGQGKAKQ
jgi:hypothetical protein